MQNPEQERYFSVLLAYCNACVFSLHTHRIMQFDLGTLLYIKYILNVSSKVLSLGLFAADA